jgi:hypothetical protein
MQRRPTKPDDREPSESLVQSAEDIGREDESFWENALMKICF